MELSEELHAGPQHSPPELFFAAERVTSGIHEEYTGVAPSNRSLGARVAIASTEDIVRARQTGRLIVQELGFCDNQSTIVATVISELARNIILYAKTGAIVISTRLNGARFGVVVEAIDAGPGIANVQNAIASGYSTSGGLGFGLSGVRNMTDEFSVRSHAGHGTTVIATIWMK
jgi:serine/threonine-protein kinase RsbT